MVAVGDKGMRIKKKEKRLEGQAVICGKWEFLGGNSRFTLQSNPEDTLFLLPQPDLINNEHKFKIIHNKVQ